MANPAAYRKADAAWRRCLALGFRITGRKIFVAAYCRGRDLLLSIDEMYATGQLLRLQRGSFLVFGAGNDSLFWATVNRSRTTVFLESDAQWLGHVREQDAALRIYPVLYTSKLGGLSAPAPLDLPDGVRDQPWDTILVDAPQGWGDGPGRSQSIFEASRLVAPGGTIFVHDCDREGEKHLVRCYLQNFRCTKITPRLWAFDR